MLLRPAASSALLSSGTDSPQLMCPHAVCIGAGRKRASVQVCVLQTHPRASEIMHREQAPPGTLQGAAVAQKD